MGSESNTEIEEALQRSVTVPAFQSAMGVLAWPSQDGEPCYSDDSLPVAEGAIPMEDRKE